MIVEYDEIEYAVDLEQPSNIDELEVGDLIYATTVQHLDISMIAEIKHKNILSSSRKSFVVIAKGSIDSGDFSVIVNGTYEMYGNIDAYYKLELDPSATNNLPTNLKYLISSKNNEFWTTRDSEILYPNQMEDEQLAKAYLFIKNNTRLLRQELAKEERNILHGMGFRVPVKDTSSVSDINWAINHISIYKPLLDEISHRELDISVYDTKPKAKPKVRRNKDARTSSNYTYAF